MIRGAVFFMLSLSLAGAASADVVHLRNGRTLRDVSVERSSGSVRVTLSQGSLVLSPREVLRVDASPARPPAAPPGSEPSPLDDPSLPESVLEVLADAVRSAYLSGSRDLARGLLASHPDAHSLFRLPPTVSLRSIYREGWVELTLRSAGEQPVLVAVPPGVQAAGLGADDSQVRFALVRAPVVVLSPRLRQATLRVPVASTRFGQAAPVASTVLLAPLAPRSALARLVRELCTRPAASSPAAQLALWIATDDIARHDLVDAGSQLTARSQLVLPLHGKQAEAILARAGVGTRERRFFRLQLLPPLPNPLSK